MPNAVVAHRNQRYYSVLEIEWRKNSIEINLEFGAPVIKLFRICVRICHTSLDLILFIPQGT
jgi:hypothetical protein